MCVSGYEADGNHGIQSGDLRYTGTLQQEDSCPITTLRRGTSDVLG